MSKLPRYKYDDLHPNHEVWKIAKWFGHEGQDLVDDTDPNDAIEYTIDSCLDPISELGVIEIFGYAEDPDCPEYDLHEDGEPIKDVCIIEVDALEWIKKNRPDWLVDEESR